MAYTKALHVFLSMLYALGCLSKNTEREDVWRGKEYSTVHLKELQRAISHLFKRIVKQIKVI